MHDFKEEQFIASSSTSAKKPAQLTVSDMNTIKIDISKEMLINACVEFVTVTLP